VLDELEQTEAEHNATVSKVVLGYNGYRTALDSTTEAVGLNLYESRKLGEYLRDEHVQILDDSADAGSRVAASIIEITEAAFGNMILSELDNLYTNHNITLGEYRTLAGGVMEDMLGMKGAGIEAAFGVMALKEGLDDGVLSAKDFVMSAQELLALLERIAASDWSSNASMYGQHIPEYAGGADFIVPSQYKNDSYLMRANAGEHVQITPAGQSTTNNNANVTVNLNVAGGDGMSIYRQFRQALDADLRARRNAGIQYAGL